VKTDIVEVRKVLAGPGMDTRQWVSFGLVEPDSEDTKSVDFDEEVGPLIAVRLVPSDLIVRCRLSSTIAGNGEGEYFPFVASDEVLVLVPEGNERAGCTIVGRMNNGVDKFPERIAGLDTNKNNFGFRRLRTAYILETASRYMIRSAKSGAFILIDEGGNITQSGGATEEGGAAPVLHVGADYVGFQTGDAQGMVQVGADSATGQMVAAIGAGGTKMTLTDDGSGIVTPGTFYISTNGVPALDHVLTVEAFVNLLPVLLQAMLATSVPPVAWVPPPPSPSSPVYAAMLAALVTAPALPMNPAIQKALQALIAQRIPSDALAVAAGAPYFPGLGSPGILVG
jgi:hypothetical protein